ncbi:MAG TPA: thioredoxin family protein [Candidatus Dormibacteraeota bacterium]|nr:thioredoxin family protein [Candidatus Dormibacteraeota bacterium]
MEEAGSGLPDLSTAELEALLAREEGMVLVSFWAPSCEPCRGVRRGLEALRERAEGICRLVAVNVEQEPEAAWRHGVWKLPTLVFFKGGVELYRIRAGALPASVRRTLGRAAHEA